MMGPNPVLTRLGLAETDRVVIIHLDDVGMCGATVDAFADLTDFGLVSSAAVMTPCPWFPAVAKYAAGRPDIDLGVHLTLNCEHESYRWGPVSFPPPGSGLVDEAGYLHRTSAATQEHAGSEEVAAEVRAQIERAIAGGIRPTHADTHMGTVAHPRFMEGYIQTALHYGLPPMMLRLDEDGWRSFLGMHAGTSDSNETIVGAVGMVARLEEMGIPLLDGLTGLPLDADPADRIAQAKAALDGLPPGVSHFIIHAARDTPELRAIAPDWPCRVADYEAFRSNELRDYVSESDLHVIGYRALQALLPG